MHLMSLLHQYIHFFSILLTMVDNRTNFAKEIAALLRETYGSKIKVFGTEIPILSEPRRSAPRARAFSPMTPMARWPRGTKI